MEGSERLRIPADPNELAAGSTLIATLTARWYSAAIPRYARGRLLELGCGKMPYYKLYRQHVDNVICTDWPHSLHGFSHLDFAADLNVGIPLGDATIDTILASDLLEHIYRPKALIAEMQRVLRPGGTAIINTPFLYWVHEAPFDFYRFTPYAIERMATEAGLRLLRLDSIGNAVCVLADVFGKLVQGLPHIGRMLAMFVQRLVLQLGQPIPQSEVHPLAVMAILGKPLESVDQACPSKL